MNKILKIFEKLTNWKSSKQIEEFLNNFYIRKYGSEEKAKAEFEKLTKKYTSKEEKQKAFEVKLFQDLHVEQLLYFRKLFSVKSLSSLAKSFITIKSEVERDWSDKEKNNFLKTYKTEIIPTYEETFQVTERKSFIINKIREAKLFTLSVARKELGYPDQRYFNRWLEAFFGKKYINRGTSNGYITLTEYLEIISAFILCEKENYSDFTNLEKMNYRFENEKTVQKKVLKKLTKNNYSYLKLELEILNENYSEFNLPEKFNKVPYRIVTLLKYELQNQEFY